MSESAAMLFAHHLDLSPLRGRRRGLVRCPRHDDRTPSLSVDLDRGIFHCFGCGVGGGLRRFAELVGDADTMQRPRPAPPRRWSPLEEARERVLAEARRQQARLEPYRDLFTLSNFVRRHLQLAYRTRRVATAVGPSERVWDLLARAAQVESAALAAEVEADAILAEGRLA